MEKVILWGIVIIIAFQIYRNIVFNLKNEEFKEVVVLKIMTYLSLLIGIIIGQKILLILAFVLILITIIIQVLKRRN